MAFFYDYRCDNETCKNEQEEIVSSIKEAGVFAATCNVCGGSMSRTFIPSNFRGHLVLKGEWPGKSIKENNYRVRRSEVMGEVQKSHYQHMQVVPNVNGEQVDSWSDAKKLAASKGYDTSTYDQKVAGLVTNGG